MQCRDASWAPLIRSSVRAFPTDRDPCRHHSLVRIRLLALVQLRLGADGMELDWPSASGSSSEGAFTMAQSEQLNEHCCHKRNPFVVHRGSGGGASQPPLA